MWRTCGPPLSALRWRVERVSRADERGVADGRHGEVYGVERLRDERDGERSWSPVERRRWCVCARTWLDAANNGVACPVNLEATHEESLQIIPLELLEMYAE